MRRRLTSRFPELAAAFVALGGALSSNDAAAQACCAGAGAYAPVRLKLWENAIVGIQVKGVDELGSFDTNWNYIHPPAGVSEQDLEQDVVAVVRFSERGQVGLQIPVVETRRADPGIAEFGGGIGDVSVSARYDFILSTDYPRLPGSRSWRGSRLRQAVPRIRRRRRSPSTPRARGPGRGR